LLLLCRPRVWATSASGVAHRWQQQRFMAMLRGNRILVALVVMAAQMAVMTFFGAMSIIIPLIAEEVRALSAVRPSVSRAACPACCCALS
jgi:Mg/Co/Ni transporter MgtE